MRNGFARSMDTSAPPSPPVADQPDDTPVVGLKALARLLARQAAREALRSRPFRAGAEHEEDPKSQITSATARGQN